MKKTQKSSKKMIVTESGNVILIPPELYSIKIPTKEGNNRFLTRTEIEVIAYLKKYPNRKLTTAHLSVYLSRRWASVRKAIIILTEAGLIKSLTKEGLKWAWA